VTATPDERLTTSMLARAGDLAHYMLEHDRVVALANGLTANGTPCTVFLAIGDYAEPVRDLCERAVRKVAADRQEADDRAKLS
jgi:hypothetical protein